MKVKIRFTTGTERAYEGDSVQVLQQCVRIARKVEEENTSSLIVTLQEKEDATYIPFSSIEYMETVND